MALCLDSTFERETSSSDSFFSVWSSLFTSTLSLPSFPLCKPHLARQTHSNPYILPVWTEGRSTTSTSTAEYTQKALSAALWYDWAIIVVKLVKSITFWRSVKLCEHSCFIRFTPRGLMLDKIERNFILKITVMTLNGRNYIHIHRWHNVLHQSHIKRSIPILHVCNRFLTYRTRIKRRRGMYDKKVYINTI